MFINIQTGEAFVSAKEVNDYDMNGKPRTTYLLEREDGTKKEVSDVAFKAWFQEDTEEKPGTMPMPGTEDPDWGDKARGLNAHQKTAKKQVENAYNFIVGALENDVTDGNTEEMPSVEQMFEEVYSEATTHLYGEGMCSNNPAPAAMQFAGKKFIRQTLAKLFKDNGYEVPEHLVKSPEKKQGTKRTYKDTPDSVGEDEVVMRAFTGMLIGVFKIVKRTKTYIAVETSKGQPLKFDKKTGIQMDAKNPKFANRIEI